MRSDSRFSKESTILSRKIDTEAVVAALNNQSGSMEAVDYRNIPVLSAYKPFEFEGVKWAIVGDRDLAEINAPIHQLVLTNPDLFCHHSRDRRHYWLAGSEGHRQSSYFHCRHNGAPV